MTIEELNNLSDQEAFEELFKCCGSTRWANQVNAEKPFESESALIDLADKVWASCKGSDYKEAFTHHPKIGDIESLSKKFASTAKWASGEQKNVESASKTTITRLAELNETYASKFGFIFIVCATGKSADEMLQLLEERIGNNQAEELEIAAAEQHKITIIRLRKLLS